MPTLDDYLDRLRKEELSAEDRMFLADSLREDLTARDALSQELESTRVALSEQKDIAHKLYLKASGTSGGEDMHTHFQSAFEEFADKVQASTPDDAFTKVLEEL